MHVGDESREAVHQQNIVRARHGKRVFVTVSVVSILFLGATFGFYGPQLYK